MKLRLPVHPGKAFTRGFHHALLTGMADAETGSVRGVPGQRHSILIEYGGKRILIHTWDYTDGIKIIPPGDVDLVLCVQYHVGLSALENVKVVPFVMFASDQVNFYAQLDALREIVRAQTIHHELGFSGRTWGCRKPWWKVSVERDWFHWEAVHGQATANGTWGQYAAKLGTWRRCLVLYGRGSRTNAAHNRRENECAALEVPMVLNYKPHHYVPFEAGVHFIYAETPMVVDELNGLQTGWERGMVKNARAYWVENMSNVGICHLFKKICDENL